MLAKVLPLSVRYQLTTFILFGILSPVFVFFAFPVFYPLGGVHHHILLSSVILSPIIWYTVAESPPLVFLFFCLIYFYCVCGALSRMTVVVVISTHRRATVCLFVPFFLLLR